MQRAGSLLGKLKLPPGSDSPEQRAQSRVETRVGRCKIVGKRTTAGALVRGTLAAKSATPSGRDSSPRCGIFFLRNLETVLGEGFGYRYRLPSNTAEERTAEGCL